jgi:uncharacterized delta-60 repeat protein
MRKHHVLAEALESRRLFAGGGLDATFALTGRLPIGFGNQFDSASSVIRQTDGKFLIGGLTSSNTTGLSAFAITRVNPDGTLDTTFGNNGRVTTSFGGSTSAQITGLAQLTTGQLLAVGLVSTGSTSDVALARYNPNGSLDTAFGTNGIATVNTGATNEVVNGIIVDGSNNVYVAGNAGNNLFAARITSAGVLDTTYGTNGVTTSPGPAGSATASLQSVVLDSSGRLVASGFRGVANGTNAALSDFLVARFTTSGALDTTFNSNGYYVTDFAGQNQPDEALGLAQQTDGKLIVGGFTGNTLPRAGAARFAVLRLNTDGTLDTTFATNGKFTSAPSGARYQSLDAVGVLSDGRIVGVGVDGDPSAPAATPDAINANFAAIRLSSAGVLDTSFGTNGLATADISGNFDEARSFVVLPDGRLTLAGLAGNPTDIGGGSDFGLAQFTSDTTATTNIASVAGPTSVTQGQSALFTITLAQPATSALTLNYTTAGSTAVAGTDFTTTSGSVTFAAGEQSKTVTVPTLANAGNTSGRAFALSISAPQGTSVSFTNSTANVSILGTGAQGTLPTLGIQNVSVTEPTSGATGSAVFVITLDNPSTLPVTFRYATADVSAHAGTDYTSATGTVTIPAGSTTVNLAVPVLNNSASTSNSSFVVNITQPTNAQLGVTNQGIASIIDTTGQPTVTITNAVTANYRLTGTGSVPFTVTLSRASALPTTLRYSTSNGTALAGTDYSGISNGVLVIPAGQTSATISVPSIGGLRTAGSTNTFTVSLTAPTNAALGSTTSSTATLVEPVFHTVAFSGNNRIAFTDGDGQTVTITATKDAQGYVAFLGTAPAAGAIRNVLQEGQDADSVVLTTSTNRSRITITTAGRGNGTTLSAVTAANGLAGVQGTTTDILGDIGSTSSALGTVVVRNLSNSIFSSAAGLNTVLRVTGAVTNTSLNLLSTLTSFTAGSISSCNITSNSDINAVTSKGAISNLTINTTGAVKTLTGASFDNVSVTATGGVTTLSSRGAATGLFVSSPANIKTISTGALTNGSVTSSGSLTTLSTSSLDNVTVSALGSITTITSRGAATGVNISTPASLRTLSAASLTDTLVDATQNISSITSRGAISNSTLRAGGVLTSVNGFSLVNSRVLAGVPAATNLFPNVGDTNYFSGLTASRLGRLTLRGSNANPAFSNSLVIAPTITAALVGPVSVGVAPVSNGIFADTITQASYRNPANARPTTFRNLTQGDNPDGSFTVRAI